MTNYIVLFTPKPTREYGPAEASGPFGSENEAADWLDGQTVDDGYEHAILALEAPYSDGEEN